MKLTINNNEFEGEPEFFAALLIGGVLKHAKVAPVKAPKVSKKYKRQYKRDCPECGIVVKGALGLGVHRRKAHPAPANMTTATN